MKKQLILMSSICVMLAACNNTMTTPPSNSQETAKGENQAVNEGDRTITQKIRQALMDDNNLSNQAKNVKIMTANGAVVLRGVVKDNNEKNAIGKKAKAVPNVKSVDNQIEIIAIETP